MELALELKICGNAHDGLLSTLSQSLTNAQIEFQTGNQAQFFRKLDVHQACRLEPLFSESSWIEVWGVVSISYNYNMLDQSPGFFSLAKTTKQNTLVSPLHLKSSSWKDKKKEKSTLLRSPRCRRQKNRLRRRERQQRDLRRGSHCQTVVGHP